MASRNWQCALAVLLLWAFFAQAVTSMVQKSPTVDEQVHLMRGYVYLKTGEMPFQLGHPILANALNALPLLALEDLPLPDDDAARLARQDNQWGVYADRLIWQSGHDVERIFFLSRLPTVALGLLFAALVLRWARQLWGNGGGLVALALFAFDPTLVAHGRLATDDVAVSLFYFAATYGLWRYLETRQRRHLALAGVALGLAQGSKFSALLLAPVFVAVVGLWRWGTGGGLRQDALALLATFAIGGLTLWAGYRFDLRPLSGWTLPVPATAYFEDLIWETHYFGREGYTFLAGQYSASGWWYYFLAAHVLKSPLPALLLLGAALLSLRLGKANGPRLMALLLPACAYLLSTLIVSLNIGYRLFIPVLPYLYVLTGRLATVVKGRQRLALVGALAWSVLIALGIHPHYLAYFNELAGGPDGGYRYLTDSNIDWGQDLPALRDLVQEQDLGRIKLSYFGTAHPSYYGLDFEPLPTWSPTPEQGNPFTRTYNPYDPAPGVYAISASHLQGVVFKPEQWDTFAWFRDKKPLAKAGYSIFLYRVEAHGPPVNVALGGVQIDELPPQVLESFGSNDLRLRWFDPQTSFVLPEQPGWVVSVSRNQVFPGTGRQGKCEKKPGFSLAPPDPKAHAAYLNAISNLNAPVWRSAALVPSSDESLEPLALPLSLGEQLEFLGYELESPATDPGRVSIETFWRVTARPDGSRAIFVHLLAPDGQVVAQWDGLDIAVEGWREGDTLMQGASFELPGDLAPGQYWLQTGVYNPATGERLAVLGETVTEDRILLCDVTQSE
jgi:hypothetical protein